jgi:hypothetical protein
MTALIRRNSGVLTAAQDWTNRISDPGVVWYHGFLTASEVDQFRWGNGINSDPAGTANADSANVKWISSGGPGGGGGFLRLTYPATGGGGAYWARPFAPFTGASNGRGINDPGANGSIALQTWNVSQGYDTVTNWPDTVSNPTRNPGWYGHPTYQSAHASRFQGNDYYIQVRVRRVSTPGPPPDSSGYNNITGKSVWFTTAFSSVPQELVTYGYSNANHDVAGIQSIHNTYSQYNNFETVAQTLGRTPAPLTSTSIQTGSTLVGGGNICDPYAWDTGGRTDPTLINGCWSYSGGWDTLTYHITPGLEATSGTRFEVWAQHSLASYPGEAGTHRKIWDVSYETAYDNNVGHTVAEKGWSFLMLAIYHNGSGDLAPFANFDFDYGQVIFSKSMIAAPYF